LGHRPGPAGEYRSVRIRALRRRETLAVELRDRILAGEFPLGSYLPGVKQLAATHAIAPSTAHWALALLKDWGMIAGGPGERAKVVAAPETQPAPNVLLPSELREGQDIASRWALLDFEVRHRGELFRKFSAEADPRSGDELYDLLLGTLRRAGRDESDVAEYEMDIRDGDDLLTTFVASRRRPSRR
jgi:DNA-binding FadR family transcriptional regulator